MAELRLGWPGSADPEPWRRRWWGPLLRAMGLRYRKNVRTLPGSPDFANRRAAWAVFVNGCYWHHHTGCRRATVPKTNREFWIKKFAANRRRDARAVRELRLRGLQVLIIWECETTRAGDLLAQILEPRRIGGG